jgi:hypothetical protein
MRRMAPEGLASMAAATVPGNGDSHVAVAPVRVS